MRKNYLQEQQGVVSIEFAMVVPVLILIWLGVAEITSAVGTSRKASLASRTAGDITAQFTTINYTTSGTNDFNNILAATLTVGGFNSDSLSPTSSAYRTNTSYSVQIRSIFVKNYSATPTPDLQGKECWYAILGPSTLGIANHTSGPKPPATVPAGFLVENTSYLQINSQVLYYPSFGSAILPGEYITMTETTYWPVRNSPEVELITDGTSIKCL